MADLQLVMADAEALLSATADDASAGVSPNCGIVWLHTLSRAKTVCLKPRQP